MKPNRPDGGRKPKKTKMSTTEHNREPSHPDPARFFTVGEIRYIAAPSSQPQHIQASGSEFPCTVIVAEDQNAITEEWLRRELVRYRGSDDVFRDAFLQAVIFTKEGTESLEITAEAERYLASLGTTFLEVMTAAIAPGPYLASRGQLLEVYRLYDDAQGAFITGILPHDDRCQYYDIKVGGKMPQAISIAVPSRLRHLADEETPFAGWRVAVKDNFAIRGIKKSLCNRAYYELYPAATETAGCIDKLRQRGACIVGTTKLASFAATEEPLECIDYQAPWNPRADGHQSPAGSSSGSGAAIAAYPWLDIAIGSDTSGSGRRPGHWNGCYAMRPSHGVLPVDGYTPSFGQFDVPTFFARDVARCKTFASKWYGNMLPDVKILPPRIIYPLEYMSLMTNTDQLAIIEHFLTDLEATLGIKHEKVSFTSSWAISPPAEAGGQSLDEYMKLACRDSFFHDDFHSFDDFRKTYQEKFFKPPYVSPPVRWQWDLSATITQAARDTAVEKLEVYRKWFCKEVMREEEYNSIIIIPIENMSPRYRDEARTHFNPIGVPMLFLSPIIRGPEFTLPIGQVPYKSRVSGGREYLPVAFDWRHEIGRWRKCVQLVPHVVSLEQHWSCLQLTGDVFEKDFQFARLLIDAGWYGNALSHVRLADQTHRFYHECGRSSDAEPMIVSAQSIVEHLQLSVSEACKPIIDREPASKDLKALLAQIHHNLGCIGKKTNDPAGTLKHFQIFNDLMVDKIGEGFHGRDKRLAISWNELGDAHMLNGQWEKGEVSFKKSIGAMKRLDGFRNIDNSSALVNLGLTYWLTDRLDEAIKVLMEGLGQREAFYGPDDRDSFMYDSSPIHCIFVLLII
ncbi:MAG: hypothetical protein Q9216_003274 [Gyalolechia sp. 2 TL-2023]